MPISHGYECLLSEIGVEDSTSQEIVLEYIFNLAKLGIEYVNNKLKQLKDNG